MIAKQSGQFMVKRSVRNIFYRIITYDLLSFYFQTITMTVIRFLHRISMNQNKVLQGMSVRFVDILVSPTSQLLQIVPFLVN